MLEYLATSPLTNVSSDGLPLTSRIEPIPYPSLLIALSWTDTAVFFVTVEGDVYEGDAYLTYYKPSLLNANVKRLVTSCKHIFAVTEEGVLYAKGYNDYYQLGTGSSLRRSNTFRQVATLPVIDITTHEDSSMIKCSDGNYYVAGNDSYGKFFSSRICATHFTLLQPPLGKVRKIKSHRFKTIATMEDETIYGKGLLLVGGDVVTSKEWLLL